MILLDTSGVLAAIDPRQEHHADALEVLMRPVPRILSPFVLAELDYLIGKHAGQAPELTLLRDVERGVYTLAPFGTQDVADAVATIERHPDLNLGLADASLVVLADRHNCHEILTLDQRHFRQLQGPHRKPFRLLPFDDRRSGPS